MHTGGVLQGRVDGRRAVCPARTFDRSLERAEAGSEPGGELMKTRRERRGRERESGYRNRGQLGIPAIGGGTPG